MVLLLVFAVLLLLSVLVSSLANRTVLSTAALFLLAGFALGEGSLGVLHLQARDSLVSGLAELALFSILFSDGMRSGVADLRQAWRLPGRALGFGLPLTLAATAALAHFVAGLPWIESFLIGAVLSPTDPAFAAAIVGRKEIPYRLRNLLSVESGLNDGLALPVVVVLLAAAGSGGTATATLVAQVLGGVAIGVGISAAAVALERLSFFAASAAYQPLNAVAVGLIVLATATLTHGNVFLAAFSAGITIASLSPPMRDSFQQFGELIAEILKLAALLVFGSLISISFLSEIGLRGYGFALLALFIARPAAIGIALLRSKLDRRERLAAAWFGPKGFASVVYGLLILDAGLALSNELFHLVALVVAASILAHSSTDVVIAVGSSQGLHPPTWRRQNPHDERSRPPADHERRRFLISATMGHRALPTNRLAYLAGANATYAAASSGCLVRASGQPTVWVRFRKTAGRVGITSGGNLVAQRASARGSRVAAHRRMWGLGLREGTGPPEERVREVGERLLATLGRQEWMDRPSYRLEHTLGLARAACGGSAVRISNFLYGTWLGHPLHPLLTSLPTGAVATTVALDVADVLPGHGSGLRDASRFTLGVGIVGSLASAVTGLNDWQHTQEQSRRVGLVHGALNAAATGLYVASWWDRRRGRHLRGVAGSGLGYGITLASGYLGAALVYRSGTGVDRAGARLAIREWTPVLPATALEAGEPQRVEVAGIGLVLFWNGEDVVAVGEHCPHLGAPMSDGWIDRGRIVCPWHGSQFEPVSGQVVRGPATASLPCYPTRLREGTIEVREGAPQVAGVATGVGG